MSKKLIIANWKMNLLRSEAEVLAKTLLNKLSPGTLKCEVVLIPPYTSMEIVHRCISNTDFTLGAQNVFWEESGAYTGEISPSMLKDIGCKWVILGHSERRQILGETDYEVRKKVLRSIESGLKVIICIGETLIQKNKGMAPNVLKRQLESALKDVKDEDASNIVIAYEPIWAIGTGNNASAEDIVEAHLQIKEKLILLFGDDADNIRVIYGGSVNENNVEEIIKQDNVDGALVGSASLNEDRFIKITEIAGE